jgi:hypothetical protein
VSPAVTHIIRSFGAASLIVSTLCLGGWVIGRFVVTWPIPAIPSEAEAIEGIADGPTVPSPVGAPVLYGEVLARFSHRSRGAQYFSGRVGQPWITVHTSTGARRVRLPEDVQGDTWVRPPTDTLADALLPADTPVLADAPRFADHVAVGQRFSLTLFAVRPGQQVTLAAGADGVASTVWFEPRGQVIAIEQARRAGALRQLGIAGLLTLALAVVAQAMTRKEPL